MANERRQAAHPTPAQVAQAEQTAVEYLESLFRAHGTSIGWEHRVLLLADLTDRIASAVATAHAEGRQAALEEAEAAVGRVLVPTALARVTETLRQLATEARS